MIPDPLNDITVPRPEAAVDFATSLAQLRNRCLTEALRATVQAEDFELARLDLELNQYVPTRRLRELAGLNLRGEVLYPVPYLLEVNPQLLSYYRLLLCFSDKEFYDDTGLSMFRSMEKGRKHDRHLLHLPALCRALIQATEQLVDGLGLANITPRLLDNLQVMTIGAQLRGSRNNDIGRQARDKVRAVILDVLGKHRPVHPSDQPVTVSPDGKQIWLTNAAGRRISVNFGSDPDVTFHEHMSPHETVNLLAIEIKGGKDRRNIHNRTGEAEKSHLTAGHEYPEFWTIVNVRRFDEEKAREKSPSTNRFYVLWELATQDGPKYRDFVARIVSKTGIRVD